MRNCVIDLDGSISSQDRLVRTFRPEILDMRRWGSKLRLGCRWECFYRFERQLDRLLGAATGFPTTCFLGSGDFHHVTLAMLRRLRQPFNLLVLDKHPDWMRGVPFLHCGTWLHHAARLPHLHRIFHAGGDIDFDNRWRLLAPWPALRQGRIVVLPARRSYRAGRWTTIPHEPLRSLPDER